MKKLHKNLIAAGVVAAAGGAVAVAASYFITKKLVSIALDRQAPKAVAKTKDRIAGSGYLKELLERQALASRSIISEEPEEIHITAADGTPLVGHWLPVEGAKRTLIAMHGWRSSWHEDFGIIAPFWLSNDCNILFAEQRGQNNSGGDYMGFGLTERFDTLDWASWVNTQEGIAQMPLYLVGISMGGATVLMASNLPHPDNLCGIAADCAFTSPKAIWQHVVRKNLKMTYGGIRHYVINDMLQDKINVDSDYSCADSLKECKVPVLLIHGTDDKFVPVEMCYENYKACPTPKKLLVVPGADHGLSYVTDQISYENAMLSFFDMCEEMKDNAAAEQL